MFCEVLLYSREKKFYKREGKNNVKGGYKKDEKKGQKINWKRD